jgi:DNA-binding XRE family transcriptional regulator
MRAVTRHKLPGRITDERRQLLEHFLGLNSRKQKRLLELAQLFRDSVDTDEKRGIADSLAEIMFRQAGDLTAVSLEVDGLEPKQRLALHREFVAKNIVKERQKRKWTQEELAEKAGLPQSHVSRLERCVHAPSYLTIEKLAGAFGIAPGQLDPSFD